LKNKRRGLRCTEEEDEALYFAWEVITLDATRCGVEETTNTFWKQMDEHFNKNNRKDNTSITFTKVVHNCWPMFEMT
jgi:hypothetical protein